MQHMFPFQQRRNGVAERRGSRGEQNTRRYKRRGAMTKIGIIVLADTETHADLGRVANALETTKEFHEAGDEVTLIFDGAGTKWVGVLSNPDHRLHRNF